MKTILVPVGGSDTDRIVFATALAAAKIFNAHLDFVHIQVSAGEAAANTPHVAFARGAGLTAALNGLQEQCKTRARVAADHVQSFCRAAQIEVREQPDMIAAVTAQYRVEDGDALRLLVTHARHHDLSIVARATTSDGLPPDRLEAILLQSGRPLLITTTSAPSSLLDTVMVCWKSTPHAARAVSAALPLLRKSHRVLVVNVTEGRSVGDSGASETARQLQWHGINAESRVGPQRDLSTGDRLRSMAAECGATLLVMGAYSHHPTRELLFGGCTQAALEAADVPILLVH